MWHTAGIHECGAQVALDIPSIKATLSDREFQLIQSMAGDNFGEAQRLPPGALWLEEQYAEPDKDEDAAKYAPCFLHTAEQLCRVPVSMHGLHHALATKFSVAGGAARRAPQE